MIWSKWVSFDKTWLADGEVLDYRTRSRTLHTVAAWSDGQINVTVAAPSRSGWPTPRRRRTSSTRSWFVLSRDAPTRRKKMSRTVRPLRSSHASCGSAATPASSAIGQAIELNGRPYQIVGVTPRGFALPTDYASADRSQVFVPLQIDPKTADHGSHGYYGVARLRPGANAAGYLRAAVHHQALTREGFYPKEMEFSAFAVTLRDEVVGEVRGAVIAVFAAVGFLLLIACFNVANLPDRARRGTAARIAVRSALGAGRGRVVRQLVAEGLVLAGVGTAAGSRSCGIVRWLTWWAPGIPRLAEAVDVRVLLFAVALTMITAAFFSLAPALRLLGANVASHLKDGAQNATAGTGRQRFRSALVIAEMALAVVLVLGAGLMMRSLANCSRSTSVSTHRTS